MAGTALRGRLSRATAWRPAVLAAAVTETRSARTLRFDVPGWPGHLPGQHVDVRLTAEDGYTAERSYSIASAPAGERIELTVQSVDGGEVSPFLVADFAVGDEVEVRGPLGGWFVWRPAQPEPILLLAGGSGLVPLMAMIRTRRQHAGAAPFRLIYSVRSPADVLYAGELAGDGGVATHLVFTRTAPDGAPHRLTRADIDGYGWRPGHGPTCYVCGPTAFVEAAAALLIGAGHDPAGIRTERFG